jgi:hypothetical protein
MGRKCKQMISEGGAVKKVEVVGRTVDTDFVLYSPNNFKASTDIFNNSTYAEDLKFDKENRICTEVDLNAGLKRMFAAGECASVPNFMNSERYKSCSYAESINQGFFAGMNMSGMGIPYHIVPYDEYDFYGKKFRIVGGMNFFEKHVVEGDLNSFDFMAYYINGGVGVRKAAGFTKEGRDMQVIREALRTSLPVGGDPEAPSLFTSVNIPKLARSIRVDLRDAENQ